MKRTTTPDPNLVPIALGLAVLLAFAAVLGGCDTVDAILSPSETRVREQIANEIAQQNARERLLERKAEQLTQDKIEVQRTFDIAGVDYRADMASLDQRLQAVDLRFGQLAARRAQAERENEVRLEQARRSDNLLWGLVGTGVTLLTGVPAAGFGVNRLRSRYLTDGKRVTAGLFRDGIRSARELSPRFNDWITSDDPGAVALRAEIERDAEVRAEVKKDDLHKPRATAPRQDGAQA